MWSLDLIANMYLLCVCHAESAQTKLKWARSCTIKSKGTYYCPISIYKMCMLKDFIETNFGCVVMIKY